jgi:hypothetical protein
VVTHKTMEILVSVARMPLSYRLLRRDVLISDYASHLECSYAKEAFLAMVTAKTDQPAISANGEACLREVQRLAGRFADK